MRRQRRVLIIDDEPAYLRVLATAIRVLGYSPLVATDAESALQLIGRERPDAVLTDVRLPGMDGVELAQQIKSRRELAAIPVLLMSGYGRPRSHEGDAFLYKPFHIDELAEALAQYLSAPFSGGGRRRTPRRSEG